MSFFNYTYPLKRNNIFIKKLSDFFPLKLTKNVNNYAYNFSVFSNFVFNLDTTESFFYFSRKFYYVRYINYFLLGFICSKSLALKLKTKFFNYLKGNLFVKNFSVYFYSLPNLKESFVFLGYKFSFCVSNLHKINVK